MTHLLIALSAGSSLLAEIGLGIGLAFVIIILAGRERL